jgi:hypothetical protein
MLWEKNIVPAEKKSMNYKTSEQDQKIEGSLWGERWSEYSAPQWRHLSEDLPMLRQGKEPTNSAYVAALGESNNTRERVKRQRAVGDQK